MWSLTDSNEAVLNAFKIEDGIVSCKIGFNKISEINQEIFSYFSYKILQVVCMDERISVRKKKQK